MTTTLATMTSLEPSFPQLEDNQTIAAAVDAAGADADMTRRAMQLKHLSIELVKYVTPVILVIGVLGNVLSFSVLVRKRMRSRSVYFYLLLLSVADTLVLVTNAFRTWFRVTFGWELYLHYSDVTCKLHMFVFEVSAHMSAWLVVMVTVDRFIAVMYPLRAARVCTGRRAAIASLTCFIVMLGYHTHIFWTYRLYTRPGRAPTCKPLPGFMSTGYNYLRCAMYSVLPFLLVLFLNLSIVIQMRRRSAESGSYTHVTSATSSPPPGTCTNNVIRRSTTADSERDITRMTRVLFLISITWLALSFPWTLYSVIPYDVKAGRNMYEMYVSFLVKIVCFLLLWINHSINFFLYCMSGRRLRMIIYEQICGCRTKKTRNGRGTHGYTTSIRLNSLATNGKLDNTIVSSM